MVCAVTLAHVRALDVPEASRQRFITSQGPFAGQDYCDVSLLSALHQLW
jgi:hypothetical protein